jgi:hypothetical protein
VWLAAAIVLARAGTAAAFATLFFGGMLISPLTSIVVERGFGRPAPSRENSLAMLGLETAIAMVGCLLAAYLLMGSSPEWVFPVAAIAVGTRYVSFATLFGMRIFWLLGGLITAIGATGIWGPFTLPGGVALNVAIVEIAFGLAFTIASLRTR